MSYGNHPARLVGIRMGHTGGRGIRSDWLGGVA